MTRLADVVAVILLTTFASGSAQEFGWTISTSRIDPLANTTTASFGVETYYLWFYCAVGVESSCIAEMGLRYDGPEPVAVQAANGWLNAGSATNLFLACSCHVSGPSTVAWIMAFSNPGTISFVPSEYGLLAGLYCTPLPSVWPIEWIGLGIDQPAPTGGTFCVANPISVEATSWGRVKGLYR